MPSCFHIHVCIFSTKAAFVHQPFLISLRSGSLPPFLIWGGQKRGPTASRFFLPFLIYEMGMCATMEDNTSSIAPKTKIVFSKAILQKKVQIQKKVKINFFFSAKIFKLESEKKITKTWNIFETGASDQIFFRTDIFFLFSLFKKNTFLGLEAYWKSFSLKKLWRTYCPP